MSPGKTPCRGSWHIFGFSPTLPLKVNKQKAHAYNNMLSLKKGFSPLCNILFNTQRSGGLHNLSSTRPTLLVGGDTEKEVNHFLWDFHLLPSPSHTSVQSCFFTFNNHSLLYLLQHIVGVHPAMQQAGKPSHPVLFEASQPDERWE